MVKFYRVGGCVRDRIMGRKCNDIDYSVEAPNYEGMRQAILDKGGNIFLENKEFLTIRAGVPGMGACDFVLCRKDGEYVDGRHPETVSPGTIYDDLARRDFTMNAIAEDEKGVDIIDPHFGMLDIEIKIIRCVKSPEVTFAEDGLRILRAIRFAIVLGFNMSEGIEDCLRSIEYCDLLRQQKPERIREELLKAFKCDTFRTLFMFKRFPYLAECIFDTDNKLWLMPTMKQ